MTTAATADKTQQIPLSLAWQIAEGAVADAEAGREDGLFIPGTLSALVRIEEGNPQATRPLYARLNERLAGELRRAVREHRKVERAQAGGGAPLIARSIPAFLADLAPPTYLLDGILIAGYCFAITGQSGHGKTAIALSLGVAASLGLPFAGFDTEQVKVLYVAGENPDDVRLRVRALLDAAQLEPTDLEPNLMVLDQSFTLADRHAELMELIEEGGFGLVILDTDQALSSDADENDNRERVEHAKRVRMLTRAAPRPTVIDLCHPPVNAGRNALRPRGGSSFLAEIDGNLGVWMDEGDTRAELFRTNKFRGPMFDPLSFEIKVIELASLADSRGRPMTAAIALPAGEPDRDADDAARTRRMDLLSDISRNPSSAIRERAERLGIPRNTVHRDIKYLLDKGAIADALQGHDLTPKGKKWLAAT